MAEGWAVDVAYTVIGGGREKEKKEKEATLMVKSGKVVFEKYGTLPYLTRLIPYGKLRKLH